MKKRVSEVDVKNAEPQIVNGIDLHPIEQALQKEKCPVHNEVPHIKVTSNGLQIKTCCKEFSEKIKLLYKLSLLEERKERYRFFYRA